MNLITEYIKSLFNKGTYSDLVSSLKKLQDKLKDLTERSLKTVNEIEKRIEKEKIDRDLYELERLKALKTIENLNKIIVNKIQMEEI